VEARVVSSDKVVHTFYRAGEEQEHRAAAAMPAILALKEKGGQWGREAIRWGGGGKPGSHRACHGGGRRAAGRPGRQRATVPDCGGGSVLLDGRKEKAGWAFWAERLLGPDCAAGPN
jgi:hypothetical protein